ncbi:MAG: CoA pyrophosphatase [Deltaproteobacteria bacterium]|nr:CoA pyrophosphatase [Deltaproteobacteria bacterium]
MDLEPGGFGEALRATAAARLRAFERVPAALDGRRAAAVALTLVPDAEGRPCWVLTRRANRLARHAGQWALPGGRVDPGESAQGAALRELAEEVGLDLPDSAVLGLLDDYPTRSGYVITPVVVWGGDEPELRADPREVAEVHRIPLAALLRPEVPRLRRIPESDRPVLSIPLPVADVHAPTAAIVYQLREVVIRGEPTRVAHFEQPVFAWR